MGDIQILNLTDNPNIVTTESKGPVTVYEYKTDLSVAPGEAITKYYMAKMGVRRRQAMVVLDNSEFILSSGAMSWMAGDIQMKSDVKGVGDFIGKAFTSRVTGEQAIKPKYSGSGMLMLEPTYKHLLLEDLSDWQGEMVVDDGMFQACEASIQLKAVARSNVSSAVLGGEGLFNLCLQGRGIAVLESPVPRSELLKVELVDDVIKIDGNFAVAWSNTLRFTVEKSSKSIVGSAVSGEGFVNVYRGTGTILMAPLNFAHRPGMGGL